MNMNNTKPFMGARHEFSFLGFTFETNNTDAPDGLDPSIGTDVLAIDQTATGTYTITFAARYRPTKLLCLADFVEDMPGWSVKMVSYVPSTGVLTLKAYDEDNTSGVQAAADSTDKTIQVWIYYSRSSVPGNP